MKKVTMIVMTVMVMMMGVAHAVPYPGYYFPNAVQTWDAQNNNWAATQYDIGHQALCNEAMGRLGKMEAQIPFIASSVSKELQWRRSATLFDGIRSECGMYFSISNRLGKVLKAPKHFTGNFDNISRLLRM